MCVLSISALVCGRECMRAFLHERASLVYLSLCMYTSGGDHESFLSHTSLSAIIRRLLFHPCVCWRKMRRSRMRMGWQGEVTKRLGGRSVPYMSSYLSLSVSLRYGCRLVSPHVSFFCGFHVRAFSFNLKSVYNNGNAPDHHTFYTCTAFHQCVCACGLWGHQT